MACTFASKTQLYLWPARCSAAKAQESQFLLTLSWREPTLHKCLRLREAFLNKRVHGHVRRALNLVE